MIYSVEAFVEAGRHRSEAIREECTKWTLRIDGKQPTGHHRYLLEGADRKLLLSRGLAREQLFCVRFLCSVSVFGLLG